MSNEPLLDKNLVQLKQKLEVLQSTFVFLLQVKHGAGLRNDILDEIVKLVEPLISQEAKDILIKGGQ